MYVVKSNTVICHHGILDQKWGVQNGPPYPLSSDISTGNRLKTPEERSESKKELAKKKKEEAKELAKKKKEEKKELAKKKKEEKKEAKIKNFKDKVISKGDVEKAKSKIELFTTSEIEEIIKRGDLSSKLSSIKTENVKTGYERLKTLASSLEHAVSVANSGVKLYNVAAMVHNSMNPDTPWKTISDLTDKESIKLKDGVPNLELTYNNGQLESRTSNKIENNKWIKTVERNIPKQKTSINEEEEKKNKKGDK